MQLTEGEDLYNIVLHAPIGICILNSETLVAELVNDKFLEVSGKPYEEISGRFYWDAFAEVRSHYEDALAGVVSTGQPYYADEVALMLIRHGTEEMIFVTFVYAPVKNKEGNITKVAVWVLENTKQVTERQKTEAAKATFKQERDRLQNFLMQAPAGICILDGPELVYELVNPAYQQLLPGRKLSGRPIFDALPELVDTPLQEELINVYQTGTPVDINELMIPIAAYEGGPTQERYFSFSYLPRRDEHNHIDGILTFVYEVTRMIHVQQDLEKAREQAEQQKRIYETIISGTPDLMYVFNLDYRFTYANDALLTMWGKDWDNAIGKNLLENGYEPWHAEMHEREIDQIKITKQPIRGEVSFPHAILGKRVYDYILTPVLNEQGAVEAVAGTTRDITERKQWEESLAQSSEELLAINEQLATSNEEQAVSNEELTSANEALELLNQQLLAARQKIEEGEAALRLAINAANFGTWFMHAGTREFIADDRLKELFGYLPHENMSIEQALAQITEEYRGFVANKLENALYNNGDYDVTYPVIGLHDERLRWLRAIGNLKADSSGAFSAFTGVVLDITEQYLAEKAIERAEESLRMAIAAAGLGTFYINATDRIFVASPKLKEFFGFGPDEELPYHAAINQIHPDYRQQATDMVEAAFTKGERFDMEYPVVGYHDERIRWVRGVGTMQHYDGKDFFTGVLHEITDQKQDELRKNDFIAMVSHELKTPLTSLTLILQILDVKLRNIEDEFIPDALNRAGIQAKRMNALIDGFLNVSRLESAQIVINKTNFDLGKLVQEIIEETKITTSSHQFVFACQCSAMVNADRDKISSVISNLLSNAIKYSPQHTSIEVSCGQEGNHFVFSVKDQGVGIKEKDLERIFDRYYRVENTQTKFISGFGIGLYLSLEIIKRHDGYLKAESEPGKGSRFYFQIPKG